MKIVVSANTSWYVWNFRLTLIETLALAGHEVVVVAPRDQWSSRFTDRGFSFFPVRLWPKSANPLRELGTFASFCSAYRKVKPDIVLQYTIKPNLYGSIAARMVGAAAVCNVTGLGEVFLKKNLLSFFVKRLYRYSFSGVHRVFFQNGDDRALFLSGKLVAESKTALLPGSGVNLERFKPEPQNHPGFTFLFVGRLLRAKGVEDFIRAARIFRSSHAATEPVSFILLGGHDPEDPFMADGALLRDAVAEGIVEHPGAVEDVRVWLDKADCVVLPSYYREGIPRSLLEAAACGKPLIAADSVGTREPVMDGVNGFLCVPRNPEDLANKMSAVYILPEAERTKMGLESRALAESRFDEKIVLTAYLDIVRTFSVK